MKKTSFIRTFAQQLIGTSAFISLFFISTAAFSQNWVWTKTASSTGWQGSEGNSTCVDAGGNVFVTGTFYGPTITFGTTTLTCGGSSNLFVAKYDASGNVLWAKSAVGNCSYGGDHGYSISADAGGNVLVTGWFQSPTITFGSITLNNTDIYYDFFLAKYDANGNVLWAKNVAGLNYDTYGYSASTDAAGNVFVTGVFFSPTITFGTTTLTNADDGSVFIAKYDASGNVLWAKSAGGTTWVQYQSDQGRFVSTDAGGNAFITGYFISPTITFGSFTLTNSGVGNAFLVKYNPAGNVLWAKKIGGTGYDAGVSVGADTAGNVFITGEFQSPAITLGSTTLTNSGGEDVFLAKYDAAGNLLWAKNAVGTGSDASRSLSTDMNGNVFVTGYFQGPAITFGSSTLINTGTMESFIVKYDAGGNVICASALASGSNAGSGIANDTFGNTYICSSFTVNPLIAGSDTLALTGTTSIFTAKYTCGTMGIDKQVKNNDQLLIYPNPSTGLFTISLENEAANYAVEVYNLQGEKVFQQLMVRGKTSEEINLSGYPKGIYFIKINAGAKMFYGKIAVQ